MLSSKFFSALILMFASVVCFSAHAEQVSIPSKSQYILDNAPHRGIAQDEVLKLYGEPASKQKGVGKPVISSWTYPEFKVYFENDIVLHAVGI